MPRGQYIVKVTQRNSNVIETKKFPYGDFKEIGYWLDYYGYIHPAFRVVITFEENA